MAINIAVLRAMAAAGATADTIIAAIEAQQIEDERVVAERRRKDKQRQRKSRASKASHRQGVTSRDGVDASEPVAGQSGGGTQDLASDTPGAAAPESAQKERSPTPPKEKHYPQGILDLEIDEGSKSSGIARARGKSACRLPDDWQPTIDDLAFARTVLPVERVQVEVEKFRDYWHARAGPHAVSPRWSARWRNWCRKAVEISNGNGHRNGNGGGNGQHRQGLNHSALSAKYARDAPGFG